MKHSVTLKPHTSLMYFLFILSWLSVAPFPFHDCAYGVTFFHTGPLQNLSLFALILCSHVHPSTQHVQLLAWTCRAIRLCPEGFFPVFTVKPASLKHWEGPLEVMTTHWNRLCNYVQGFDWILEKKQMGLSWVVTCKEELQNSIK